MAVNSSVFWKASAIVGLTTMVLLSGTGRANSECVERTQNFCRIDQSARYEVFCRYDSGDTYEGYHNCDRSPTAFGVYTWDNGQKYEGQWRNGDQHGRGTLTWGDGQNSYDGEWRNGKKNGQGTRRHPNGVYYVGNFRNGELHGEVTHHWSGGKRVGQYKDGKPEGKFLYYYNNGSIREFIFFENGNEFAGKWIKTLSDIEAESAAKKKRQEADRKKQEEQQRQWEREQVVRAAEVRKENLQIDKCLLQVFKDEEKWSIESARFFCRKLVSRPNNDLFAGCMIVEGVNKNHELIEAAENVCLEVSRNPSTWDQIRYGKYVAKIINLLK